MKIIAITANNRGGWSILLAGGQAVGNYASYADALRIARYNGYTDAKKDALSK